MTDAQFKILIRVLFFGFTCLLCKSPPDTGYHRLLEKAAKEAGVVYL